MDEIQLQIDELEIVKNKCVEDAKSIRTINENLNAIATSKGLPSNPRFARVKKIFGFF